MKEIKLTQDKVALVDDDIYEKVVLHKWHAERQKKTWYAYSYIDRVRTPMHRFILDTPSGMMTDHINHNGLDNRRGNIRVCTMAQNQYNQTSRGTTSCFKGVNWHTRDKRWQARIRHNGKRFYLGNYLNEHEAAVAYSRVAGELQGEFAYMN